MICIFVQNLQNMGEKTEYLKLLEKEVNIVKGVFKEASQTIMQDGVSNFPIFIAYKNYFPIGEKLLEHTDAELDLSFSFNISTAEEFIKKGIIAMDKAKFFVANYKSTATHFCLFVVNEEGDSNFVFVPY